MLSGLNKILIIGGAKQIGKTYIIHYTREKLFKNYIEINMVEDFLGNKLFENVKAVDDFYLQVSMIAGEKMNNKENTLIFIYEILAYPHLLTLLKFLKQDDKFTYIASESLLGVTLAKTTSVPIGSIEVKRMYLLDLEEVLISQGFNDYAIDGIKKKFENEESLDVNTHERLLDLFKKYLLVGGPPDAVNSYNKNKNIVEVRNIQDEIHEYYAVNAANI